MVIAQLASENDPEPATIRVRAASGNTFQIQIDEWDYLSPGAHNSETIDYIVIEAGIHQLPGGATLVAGKDAAVNHNFKSITFPTGNGFNGFASTPLVFTQAMTDNGPEGITTRLQNISTAGFQVRVQEQELNEYSGAWTHASETVGYVALVSGGGTTLRAGAFQATSIGDTTDVWRTINFGQSMDNNPLVLAANETFIGQDPASVRLRSVSPQSFQVHLEEENSGDPETVHSNPDVLAYLAFAQPGRLYETSLLPSAPTITYTYDASGHRVQRTRDPDGGGGQPATSEYFVYDGTDLSMRFDNAQKLSHRYVYGPQTDQVLVDEVFKTINSQQVSDEILWQLADHEGTIRDIVNDSGALRKHVDYDSFGQITNETTYGQAVEQLFGFTGQELDKDAGLYNYNARWYDPRMGRFISEDPSGFGAGDANLYRYVGNDPVDNTDPSGLFQAGNPLYNLSSLTSPLPSFQGSPDPNYARQNVLNSPWFSDTLRVNTPLAAPRAPAAAPVVRATSIAPSARPSNNAAFSLWGRNYVWPWSSNASLNPFNSVVAVGANQVAGKVGGLALGVNTPISTASGVDLVVAGGRGTLTGGKAVVNSAAGTVVSAATLGFKDYAGFIPVNDYDRSIGYDTSAFIARGSTELAFGLATGAAGNLGRIGKAVTVFDTAGNLTSVGRGGIDAYNNGLSFGNATQVVGGGLGLSGNVAAGGRALQEVAQDASRVRLSFDPATVSMGGLGGVNVALAPKVHLNTNTAVGNFGVYDIFVNDALYKVGKADLSRVTQSSGLPTRIHQQIRTMREVYGSATVKPGPIVDLGTTTTSQAKLAELARVQSYYNRTGVVPPGNIKSFRP